MITIPRPFFRRIVTVLARLCASVALAGSLPALAVEYTVTDLGALVDSQSFAFAVNNAGQVVGRKQEGFGASYPVLWQGGSATTLATPQGREGTANAINEAGQVVGATRTASGAWHATLWNGNTPTDLRPLSGDAYSYASGINGLGQIVGSVTVDSSTSRAALWNTSTGAEVDLAPPNAVFSDALAINDAGVIAGVVTGPTLWNGTTVTSLASDGIAFAINDAGIAAGRSVDNAVVFDAEGMVVLGRGVALGINNRAQVVGHTFDGSYWGHASLWNGTAVIDLNDFADPAWRADGWLLHTAFDINDNGWIVGSAINVNTGGETHAFLLTPVPEPGVNAMLLGGLGLIGAMHRRLRRTRSSREHRTL